MTSRPRRSRIAATGLALLAVIIVPAFQQLPASADGKASARPGTSTPSIVTPGDTIAGLPDITDVLKADGRTTMVALPSIAQKDAATALGSGVDVLWNDSGTPSSILAQDGVLGHAAAGASPEAAARSWIGGHRALFGLTDGQIDGLELVSLQPLAGGVGHSVLLQQKFGTLEPATRSMVTVSVRTDGTIVYVSSSLVKASGAAPAATLSPLEGWLKAAANVGRPVAAADVAKITSTVSAGWTRLTVPGFAQTNLARLRAFAKPDGTVRPVIESDVIDSVGGSSLAYRVMVDAVDGTVLFRQNAVENSNNAFQFQGTYTPTTCGPKHPFAITDTNTKTIIAGAAAVVAADDIKINLYGPTGAQIGSYDLATSPETATYSATTLKPILPGTYSIEVCPFDAAQIGSPYSAFVTTSDTAVSASASLPNPRWRAFAANPSLASVAVGTVPTNSVIECWFPGTEGCSPGEAHKNVNGPVWDGVSALSSFTTVGNNANTHEAWASFLTPGGAFQAPVSAARDYTGAFTDNWNESGCALTSFTPLANNNDVVPVTTNLFTGHNRIHDFAYSLGFTEELYNLQLDNGTKGGTGGDQEIGNVQAGAVTGGAAGQYMGRDNANQIAMQDGVAGITNQYLFQPIAGAFYSPCTDGALDTGIYGHEYTHAISNRMVGGPSDGLTSDQGGAMGESWSDLNASEYEFENDYGIGTLPDGSTANPWSLGSYTTGNFTKGIRDYAINDNPLNYSDYGFDSTGAEVHADGEVWNGTLWEVRQALVNKYDALGFKYTDKALQDRCATPTAEPTTPQPAATACPGNRRWLQLIYDAWPMQPGATDMLQARNAMIASDQMRFGGADVDIIAAAFARRGMGADATTAAPPDGSTEDITTPSFRSALGNNSVVTFTSAGAGNVYVGDYEARATPVAATNTAGSSPSAAFTPGVYKMTFVSPTRGLRRFVLTVPDDGKPVIAPVDDTAVNLAAAASGAKVIGATADSLNAADLIDGTETTSWGVTTSTNVDESQPFVAVDLAGDVSTITSAKVSALLHPSTPGPLDSLPVLVGQADDDPTAGSRFTALRQFALEACVSACDTAGATWNRFFTSAADAFPGDIPRPVAPDETMRSFTFPATQAAAVRLVTLNNQCTGQAKYAGEQDTDPTNDTDCKTASDRGTIVHASELQVFGGAVPADPAPGVPGTGVPGSGTAGQGTSSLPMPGQASLGTTTTASTSRAVVKTKTRIRLPRVQQVKGKESTKVKYQVVGIGGTSLGKVAGKVIVKLDGKKMKKKSIAVTLKQGRKVVGNTFRVPKTLGFGKHYIQVVFKTANGTLYTSSKSRRILLTVVRTRPNVR